MASLMQRTYTWKTLGDGEGQEILACCWRIWGHEEQQHQKENENVKKDQEKTMNVSLHDTSDFPVANLCNLIFLNPIIICNYQCSKIINLP